MSHMPDKSGNPNFLIKSRAEQMVEAREGRPVPALLQELYVRRRMTQAQIATELGVSRATVIRWMTRYGFVGRHPREFQQEAA
jgi:DNA-binding MurR/RpiR family transcriptional regulator